MSELFPYVVKQGDHLQRLALRRGFDADKIWNEPANAGLKKIRKSYNILLPGDVLYIPDGVRKWLPVTTGSENPFSAKVPRTKITHKFVRENGALANKSFQVNGAGPMPKGTTDGDGTATFDLPIWVETFIVSFDSGESYHLGVGHLDPANTQSGCDQRLAHLGLLSHPHEDDSAELDSDRGLWRAFALSSFQKQNGLPETGTLDAATAAKLEAAFGS